MNFITKDIITILFGILILLNIRTIIYAYVNTIIYLLENILLIIINILEFIF